MAQLNIKKRQAGDVTILDLDGEVRIGRIHHLAIVHVAEFGILGRSLALNRLTLI